MAVHSPDVKEDIMNDNKKVNVSINLPWVTIIQIIFILLKVTKIISWSWAIVFLPFILTLGLIIFLLIVMIIIFILESRC